MCFPSLCPALRKGNGNRLSFQSMLIAPAVFLRQGFFCPKPDIGNKIHSRACRIKAALSGKLRRVSYEIASRAGLALPLRFQNSRRLLPPSPLMTGYLACLILHGNKSGFFSKVALNDSTLLNFLAVFLMACGVKKGSL
jgi:hypothetical protein